MIVAPHNVSRQGSIEAIEGPFYLPNAPVLEAPYVLPPRSDEGGQVAVMRMLNLHMQVSRAEEMPSKTLETLDLPSGFRNAMRLATTVSIVTCVDEDGWHGMTATAITSVCTDPPALLVCVNKATAFYGRLSASGNFCINLLRSSHVQVSQAFGGGVRGVERFDTGNWTVTRSLPYLIDAQADLFCKTEAVTHFGTHGIFIGSVEEVRFAMGAAPLVYQDGHYVTTSQFLEA